MVLPPSLTIDGCRTIVNNKFDEVSGVDSNDELKNEGAVLGDALKKLYLAVREWSPLLPLWADSRTCGV